MLIGHDKQKEYLEKMIFSKKIPHALIFEGMSGLGKKKTAIHFFKKINCIDKLKKEPCEKCENCSLINELNHPDLIVVEAEKKEIQINQIKQVIHKTSFFHYSSPIKQVIINDAHLMNKEAANSLLKILEEPKKDTILILITNNSKLILDTVKSRAQRIKFFPLETIEIISLLEKIKCDKEKIKEISSFSFGVPGKAIEFALNYDKIKKRKNKIKDLAKITSFRNSFHLKFQYAKKISEDYNDLNETLEIWLNYLRILLLEKSRKNKIDSSFHKIKNFLKEIEKAIYLTSKTNVNNRLIIENLILQYGN